MEKFTYEGYREGIPAKGQVKAASIWEAEQSLLDMGLMVDRIEPICRPFREVELIQFTSGMASLMRSGVPLSDAGWLWSEDEKQANTWTVLFEKVREGIPFSEAGKNHFPPYLIAMFRIGEATGTLPQSFENSTRYLQEKKNLRQTLVSALTYPAIVLTAAVIAVTILLVYVLPIFQEMYHKFDTELPGMTLALMAAMGFLRSMGVWILLGMGLSFWFLVQAYRSESKRLWLDQRIYQLPGFGNFLRIYHEAQLCGSLGHLLHAGVGLLDALNILIPLTPNRSLGQRLAQARDEVAQGISLVQAMDHYHVLTKRNLKMVEIAEESGTLAVSLLDLGVILKQSVDQKTKTFAAIFEPVLIVGLALGIGLVLVALYLPMFDIVQVME